MALGDIIRSISLPVHPWGLIFDGKSFWYVNWNPPATELRQVDPVSGALLVSLPAFDNLRAIAFDGKGLWGSDGNDTSYFSFTDPTAPDRSFLGIADGLCFDGRYLWRAFGGANRIYQHDPETMAVVNDIPSPAGNIRGLTWDGKYLWSSDATTNRIYQQDPLTGAVLISFASGLLVTHNLAFDGKNICCASRQAVPFDPRIYIYSLN